MFSASRGFPSLKLPNNKKRSELLVRQLRCCTVQDDGNCFVYEEMKGRPVMVDDIKPSTDGNGMTIAVDPKKTDGDWQHRWKEADFSYPGCFQSCGSSSGGGRRYVCGLELSAGAEPAGHSGQRPCLCEDRCFLRVRRRSAAATVRSCSTVRFRNIVLPIFPATAPT